MTLMRGSQYKEVYMDVVTEGLGSSTVVTEGYGYVPRAIGGIIVPGVQHSISEAQVILRVKEAVANAFTSLRLEFGSEVSVEAIWGAIDEAILTQPGVYKKPNLEGMSPATLAQMGYGGR